MQGMRGTHEETTARDAGAVRGHGAAVEQHALLGRSGVVVNSLSSQTVVKYGENMMRLGEYIANTRRLEEAAGPRIRPVHIYPTPVRMPTIPTSQPRS